MRAVTFTASPDRIRVDGTWVEKWLTDITSDGDLVGDLEPCDNQEQVIRAAKAWCREHNYVIRDVVGGSEMVIQASPVNLLVVECKRHRDRRPMYGPPRPGKRELKRLSEEDLAMVLAGYAEGLPLWKLAELVGMHRRTLVELVDFPPRIRPGAPGERNHQARLSDGQVAEIRWFHANGVPTRTLGEQYGVRQDHIRKIVSGKRRKTAKEQP